MFGGKDKVQDKAIRNINNHLSSLWSWVKAFENYHKEMNKLLPKIFSRLSKLEQNMQALYNHISSLEATIKAMQKRDEEFARMFSSLAAVSSKAVEATTPIEG